MAGRNWICAAIASTLAVGATALAQPAPDWRPVGNHSVQLSLAGPASGPVDRVWYTPDGSKLLLRTKSGVSFETSDFEHWRSVDAAPPAASPATPGRLPEPSAKALLSPVRNDQQFAVGNALYRSDDGGANWTDLTGREAILGRNLTDVAVSPSNPDELAVAGSCGVWRSLDGGVTWASLNDNLPNLPAKRLRRGPAGLRGLQLVLQGLSAEGVNPDSPVLAEWSPGERRAWQIQKDASWQADEEKKRALSQLFGLPITVMVSAGNTVYAGSPEGWVFHSRDGGATWRPPFPTGNGTSVTDIYVDPQAPQLALIALSSKSAEGGKSRVLRLLNGTAADDLTGNLPEGGLRGIMADRASGALYVAGDAGVFLTFLDLLGTTPPPVWTPLSAKLPSTAVIDVKLDTAGNQLYVVLNGYGVYSTLAPHRWRDPRVVSAADFAVRPAAPGSLLSILGSSTSSVRSGTQLLPVLSNTDQHVEVQVPFATEGSSLQLVIDGTRGKTAFSVPLQKTSPAIFTDRTGTPLLLDGESGSFLDASTPAKPGARVQILATGLGSVTPAWPTGMPAPSDNPPVVSVPVKVYLDRLPVEVTRATLAPGYVGMYLVEVSLPQILNSGPAELYVEVEGQSSNRVRIYLEN